MKGKKYLFIGLFFGIVIGWALGFLRLPLLEKNDSFWLGFLAALTFISLVLVLLAAWNRDVLGGLMGKKTAMGVSKSTRTHTFVWILLLGMLVLGGVVGGRTVYRQTEAYKLQIQKQDQKIREMAALVEFVKKSDPVPLVRSILNDVGEELKHNPGRTLRDTTIARIAALSVSLIPYKYMEGDSMLEKACSPGRGQLLQALVLMNIDSGSFARIKLTTVFAGADLRGTYLKGADLSGINLQGSNMKDANLSASNLQRAKLSGATLYGANLTQANLNHADLNSADLSWAQLNEARLHLVNLNGANLSNAQLIKADLSGASIRWAQAVGALFNEANLTKVSILGTNLTNVSLRQANLSDTDLRLINLSEADIAGVVFDKASVDEKWSEKLEQWKPSGMKEFREKYSVINDSNSIADERKIYHLIKN